MAVLIPNAPDWFTLDYLLAPELVLVKNITHWGVSLSENFTHACAHTKKQTDTVKFLFPSFWNCTDHWPCCEVGRVPKSKHFRWGPIQKPASYVYDFFPPLFYWLTLESQTFVRKMFSTEVYKFSPAECFHWLLMSTLVFGRTRSDVWVWVTHHSITFGSESSEVWRIYVWAAAKSGVESSSNLLRKY